MRRLDRDGTLDASFGQGGSFRCDPYADYAVRSGVLQADGKIVIAGATDAAKAAPAWIVERVNPGGTLDTGFGNGGRAVTAFSDGSGREPSWAVPLLSAVQPDGRIIVGGVVTFIQSTNRDGATFPVYQPELALARYLPDGTLDTTWSGDGKLTDAPVSLPPAAHWALFPAALAVQADGKLLLGVATAWSWIHGPGAARSSSLLRYNPDGTRDTSFGKGGVLPNGCAPVYDLALQQGGKILVTGNRAYADGADPTCTQRLNADGAPDPSFDHTAAHRLAEGTRILVQPDGRIVNTGLSAASDAGPWLPEFLRLWP